MSLILFPPPVACVHRLDTEEEMMMKTYDETQVQFDDFSIRVFCDIAGHSIKSICKLIIYGCSNFRKISQTLMPSTMSAQN